MSDDRPSLDAYLASKSNAWLAAEFEQALAAATDTTQPDGWRESAMAAACSIAGETKWRLKTQPNRPNDE